MEKTVYSMCFMCSIRCPIKVTVKDGQVTFIEGNPKVAGMIRLQLGIRNHVPPSPRRALYTARSNPKADHIMK